MTIKFTQKPKEISKQDARDFNPKYSEILDHAFDCYDVAYIGKRISDDWEHDAFSVSINGIDFSYKTGLGHRTELKRGFWPLLVHAPAIDDVLHALILDAESGSENLGDFCANLGYDEDSRKALEIYLECQKTHNKVRGILPISIDKAIDLFSDY